MTTAVDNIDDLEALLAGLDEDELNSLSIDDDVTDAVLVEEPVVTPPVKPKRKLKPLADSKPTVAPTADADLEAELSDLDLDDEPGSIAVSVKETDEGLVMGLAEEPSVAISDETEARIAALPDAVKQELVNKLNEIMEQPGNPLPTQADIDKALEELTPKQVLNQDDEKKDAEHLGVATAAEVLAEAAPDDDMAIEALLAASTAAAPADPTASAPIKPKSTVRPTFSAAGPLKTFIDADKLQDDLNFTTTNISLAMTRQAALFAHYSRFSAEAAYQSDRCKQQVDLLYANLDQQFRDSMTTAGTKFTEKTLESMIIKDGSYQEAQTRAHEARAIAKMVETTAESFKHRKDMLIQVGADLRQEKSGSGLVVREHPGAAATRNM